MTQIILTDELLNHFGHRYLLYVECLRESNAIPIPSFDHYVNYHLASWNRRKDEQYG